MLPAVWDVKTMECLLALNYRIVQDRNGDFLATDVHHVGEDHEVDVLGYEQAEGWHWQAEFVVGTPYEVHGGLRWHTNGRGIHRVESDNLDGVLEALKDWLQMLETVRPELPYPIPDPSRVELLMGQAIRADTWATTPLR